MESSNLSTSKGVDTSTCTAGVGAGASGASRGLLAKKPPRLNVVDTFVSSSSSSSSSCGALPKLLKKAKGFAGSV